VHLLIFYRLLIPTKKSSPREKLSGENKKGALLFLFFIQCYGFSFSISCVKAHTNETTQPTKLHPKKKFKANIAPVFFLPLPKATIVGKR